MACNVLPHMDNQICSFERWPIAPLDTISDREHRKLIQRFATWEVLARLRSRAATKPITPAGRYYAGDQVKQATAFLGWLAHQGRTLPSGDQADIDTWHAQYAEHDRRRLRGVLLCSMTSKLTHPLRLPAPVITRNAPLARTRAHGPARLPAQQRGAFTAAPDRRDHRAALRPIRSTTSSTTNDQVLLRLGEPPSPVPTPFARLRLAWIDERDNMNTATNPNSRWLFPDRRAEQPMHPRSLTELVNKLGVPTSTGRTAAIHQHVVEMPAPVADALGYHPSHHSQISIQAGATWSRYASGDRVRTGDS